MDKININTSVQQECTCEELDAIAHDYFGIQQSLDDESYGCRATDNITLPDKIKATDGVYSDTKEALEDMGVTVNGTEYVRILDEEVIKVLNERDPELSDDGKWTDDALKSIAITESYDFIFGDNTSIRNADFFEHCTQFEYMGIEIYPFKCPSFYGCSNLESIKLPDSIRRIGCFYNTIEFGGKLKEIDFNKATSINVSLATTCKKVTLRTPCTIARLLVSSTQVIPKVCTTPEVWFSITWSLCGNNGYGGYGPLTYAGGTTLYLISDPDTPLGTSTTPLTIPSSITAINAYALYNLQSCVNLHYEGTVNEWLSVTKGTSWHYNIGTDFIQCTDGKAGLDDTTDTGNTYTE